MKRLSRSRIRLIAWRSLRKQGRVATSEEAPYDPRRSLAPRRWPRGDPAPGVAVVSAPGHITRTLATKPRPGADTAGAPRVVGSHIFRIETCEVKEIAMNGWLPASPTRGTGRAVARRSRSSALPHPLCEARGNAYLD